MSASPNKAARTTTRRLVRILALLDEIAAAPGRWQIVDLARRHAVTPQTIVADLALIAHAWGLGIAHHQNQGVRLVGVTPALARVAVALVALPVAEAIPATEVYTTTQVAAMLGLSREWVQARAAVEGLGVQREEGLREHFFSAGDVVKLRALGRSPRPRGPNVLLTPEQRAAILADPRRPGQVAADYGVPASTVSNLRQRARRQEAPAADA